MAISANSGRGEDLGGGIWFYKDPSDLRGEGKLKEAEAEMSKVVTSFPPSLPLSLLPFLPSFLVNVFLAMHS